MWPAAGVGHHPAHDDLVVSLLDLNPDALAKVAGGDGAACAGAGRGVRRRGSHSAGTELRPVVTMALSELRANFQFSRLVCSCLISWSIPRPSWCSTRRESAGVLARLRMRGGTSRLISSVPARRFAVETHPGSPGAQSGAAFVSTFPRYETGLGFADAHTHHAGRWERSNGLQVPAIPEGALCDGVGAARDGLRRDLSRAARTGGTGDTGGRRTRDGACATRGTGTGTGRGGRHGRRQRHACDDDAHRSVERDPCGRRPEDGAQAAAPGAGTPAVAGVVRGDTPGRRRRRGPRPASRRPRRAPRRRCRSRGCCSWVIP